MLGARLATAIDAGDVVSLSGDLGAGKTALVQGLAAGLGVTTPVTSPTFMLQRIHHGRLPLVHIDVYRLNELDEVAALGDEAFARDVVTVIEWGDTIAALLPGDRLDVELQHVDDLGDDSDLRLGPHGGLVDLPRTVVVHPRGAWLQRLDQLATLVEPND